ncbi:hypothetical protein IMZ48_04095 [Candidatus Bathyarchaeota archaeon]|nr:hypothetical protein [Candidatus Bathyarchaeota archaeon]
MAPAENESAAVQGPDGSTARGRRKERVVSEMRTVIMHSKLCNTQRFYMIIIYSGGKATQSREQKTGYIPS